MRTPRRQAPLVKWQNGHAAKAEPQLHLDSGSPSVSSEPLLLPPEMLG